MMMMMMMMSGSAHPKMSAVADAPFCLSSGLIYRKLK